MDQSESSKIEQLNTGRCTDLCIAMRYRGRWGSDRVSPGTKIRDRRRSFRKQKPTKSYRKTHKVSHAHPTFPLRLQLPQLPRLSFSSQHIPEQWRQNWKKTAQSCTNAAPTPPSTLRKDAPKSSARMNCSRWVSWIPHKPCWNCCRA